MIPFDIQVSRSKGRSKVKPTSHMLGKGDISALQTSILFILSGSRFSSKPSPDFLSLLEGLLQKDPDKR